jgi:hypothetical protein
MEGHGIHGATQQKMKPNFGTWRTLLFLFASLFVIGTESKASLTECNSLGFAEGLLCSTCEDLKRFVNEDGSLKKIFMVARIV